MPSDKTIGKVNTVLATRQGRSYLLCGRYASALANRPVAFAQGCEPGRTG